MEKRKSKMGSYLNSERLREQGIQYLRGRKRGSLVISYWWIVKME